MRGRFRRWLKAPLSPLSQATVAVLAATVLIAAMLDRRWGAVTDFAYVFILAGIVGRLVWLPLASRHARRKVQEPAE